MHTFLAALGSARAAELIVNAQKFTAANEARDYERQLIGEADEEYLEGIEEEGTKINEVDTEAFREVAEKDRLFFQASC